MTLVGTTPGNGTGTYGTSDSFAGLRCRAEVLLCEAAREKREAEDLNRRMEASIVRLSELLGSAAH